MIDERTCARTLTASGRVLFALVIAAASGCANAGLRTNAGVPTTAASVTPPVVEFSTLAQRGDSLGIARSIRKGCHSFSPVSDCYEAQFVWLAASGSVKLAMGALGRLGSIDPEVQRGGHQYAHAIGITAGAKRGDVATTFTQCSEAFQSGCYHGVIQAWFAGLDSIAAADANALCAPFRADESLRWIRFQCVHGMGHGLTTLHDHDLPKGLAGCDLLSDGWDRQACYSGAFMENIVNVTNPHHPGGKLAPGHDMADMKDMEGMDHDHGVRFKPIDPSDQHYPCSAVAERYLSACYSMQTSVMLYNNKSDMAATARECDRAPLTMRLTCYTSLGRDISSYSNQNHAAAIRMCSLGTPKYQPWCYFGLVKNIIDLDARAEDGMSLCKDVRGTPNKAICYTAVGEQISLLATAPEKKTAMCSSAESEYVDACLFGSRVRADPPLMVTEVWKTIR